MADYFSGVMQARNIDELYKRYVGTGRMPEALFDKLSAMDETPEKIYLESMCRIAVVDKIGTARIVWYFGKMQELGIAPADKPMTFIDVRRTVEGALASCPDVEDIGVEHLYQDDKTTIDALDDFAAARRHGVPYGWCVAQYPDAYGLHADTFQERLLFARCRGASRPHNVLCIVIPKRGNWYVSGADNRDVAADDEAWCAIREALGEYAYKWIEDYAKIWQDV